MNLPPAVLWIDPGKDTGLAFYARHSSSFMATEGPFMYAAMAIEDVCGRWQSALSVGWEQFTIRPTTPPADAHHAIEMIGVARLWAMRHGCTILTAATQEQRKVATQEMLEALGWWLPGKDDAQSAAQHALAWMMRSNALPSKEAGILAALRQH